MFSLLAIASLSLGAVGLGWYCKILLAKVGRLELENEILRKQKEVAKKQLDIAAGPSVDPDTIIKLMQNGAL
jgi:hypothetical protein